MTETLATSLAPASLTANTVHAPSLPGSFPLLICHAPAFPLPASWHQKTVMRELVACQGMNYIFDLSGNPWNNLGPARLKQLDQNLPDGTTYKHIGSRIR
jgi:hypothetical protein